MKFVTLDANRRAVGFYSSDVHGSQIPSGALEISDAEWLKYLEFQGRARFSEDMKVVVDPAPLPSITEMRASVDGKAEEVRKKYVPHHLQVAEYEQAENDAKAYKAAGYAGDVPPAVATWATAKGWTAQQAADDILIAAAQLRGKLMQIRAVRLTGKEAIAAGDKTLQQVLAELDAL